MHHHCKQNFYTFGSINLIPKTNYISAEALILVRGDVVLMQKAYTFAECMDVIISEQMFCIVIQFDSYFYCSSFLCIQTLRNLTLKARENKKRQSFADGASGEENKCEFHLTVPEIY